MRARWRSPVRLALAAAGLCLTLGSCASGSPGRGELVGTFELEGGVGGAPRLLSGTVVLSRRGVSRRIHVGADGRFEQSLPPGRYSVSGSSPQYASGQVCEGPAVRVSPGKRAHVTLVCNGL